MASRDDDLHDNLDGPYWRLGTRPTKRRKPGTIDLTQENEPSHKSTDSDNHHATPVESIQIYENEDSESIPKVCLFPHFNLVLVTFTFL